MEYLASTIINSSSFLESEKSLYGGQIMLQRCGCTHVPPHINTAPATAQCMILDHVQRASSTARAMTSRVIQTVISCICNASLRPPGASEHFLIKRSLNVVTYRKYLDPG